MIDKEAVRKILVIKLRAVGDVVLSTIVLKNLRHAFERTSIEFLTEPAGGNILMDHPLIDSVMVFDKHVMSSLGLIRKVRRQQYDLVIDLFGNPRTALITKLSGARYRVGYRFRGRSYAYNILVEPRGGEVHNTQFNLDALESIGVPVIDRTLHIVPRIPDEERVATLWPKLAPHGERVIAMNVGGGWAIKRWPLDRFAALADSLMEECKCLVMLTWGPGEEGAVAKVRAMMRRAPIVPPPTTLLEMAALLRRCAMMVSNDSGPMHIGAAMGIPVLGIFGPTSPRLQGPWGTMARTVQVENLDCLGCNLTKCPIGNLCMQQLTVERVLEAATTLWAEAGRQH